MRIVSGSLKGRRIIAPKNLPARPTTDYAKESLFNILQHDVSWPDTKLVDLFCGIGSIGLEALSRGANYVWSIDAHAPTVRWLQSTLKELKVDDRSTVLRADALRWIESANVDADMVFADPPLRLP